MKRTRLLTLTLLMLALSTLAARSAFAQGPTPTTASTPSVPPVQGNIAPTGPSPDDVMKLAQRASADAAAANANANNVVNNANNAVNTVNLLLNFIQAASLFGGVLASAFAILGARAGLNTLNDYRKELNLARAELDEMRSGLNRETEQVRQQADRAVRALALMQLGEQQLERRNIKGALQTYRQAYELDPDNHAINYFLGELYVQDQQLDLGIQHLENALEPGTDYAPAEAALGYAFRQQADRATDPNIRDTLYAQAEERFLRALQSDPAVLDVNGESVEAVLGGLYKRQGRADKSIQHYEEARKITPQKSYPVINLAILYFMQGNLEQALPLFDRAAEMSTQTLDSNSFDYWARLDRLTASIAEGNLEKAVSDLALILQQVKTPTPLETATAELIRLKNSPKPPKDIDRFILRMQDAIQHLKAGNPIPTPPSTPSAAQPKPQ